MPLLLCASATAATASAQPQLGLQKLFLDWAVACDNRLACQAVTLQPEEAAFDGPSLLMTRASQTGDIAITLGRIETKSDRYSLLIDGRVADTGPIKADTGSPIIISGLDALRLARMMAKGSQMVLRDGKRQELGRISLNGSAAALRYMDAVQNRATTATAIVQPGRRDLRVKWMPAPVITAKRITPTSVTPDATTLVSLIESSACKDERYGVTEDTAYSLGTVGGKAQALVMISCGAGAYNFASAAFIGVQDQTGKWQFAPAQFDYGDRVRTMDDSMQLLVNADWNATTQTLSSYAKGRGLGDCGNAESYIWDGARFRLISAYALDPCRGALDWLTLWQAEVRRVD
jgi:hypothetical protein